MLEKVFFVRVPLNDAGLQELDDVSATFQNDRVFRFSWQDSDYLMPLLLDFNDRFHLLIDLYEDETLPAEHVAEALAMAKAYIAEHSDEPDVQTVIGRLVEALELAQSLGMPVLFDF
jgi:hypothetical protein